MSLGITEIVIVAAVAFLLFGSTVIPRLARSWGSVRTEFDAGRGADPVQ